ncbi:MAG: hypothetical protein AAFY11_16235, partial [Cyanobacteria bacterium J06641_5]
MIAKLLKRLAASLGKLLPIPAARFYVLLAILGAVSPLVAVALGRGLAVLALLAIDTALLLALFVDHWRVRSRRVAISRQPLDKMSIGRENPVILQVQSPQTATNTALVRVRDGYPASFDTTVETFAIAVAPDGPQDLIYAVRPDRRGEYRWGNIHLQQLGPWGLAWHAWQVAAEQT